jgi:hypothetical protein
VSPVRRKEQKGHSVHIGLGKLTWRAEGARGIGGGNRVTRESEST